MIVPFNFDWSENNWGIERVKWIILYMRIVQLTKHISKTILNRQTKQFESCEILKWRDLVPFVASQLSIIQYGVCPDFRPIHRSAIFDF